MGARPRQARTNGEPRGSFHPQGEGLSGIPTIKTLITDIEAGPGCRVTDQGLQNKPKIRYFLFQDNETAPFSPSRQPPPRPALVWAANNTTMSFGKVEKNMIFP